MCRQGEVVEEMEREYECVEVDKYIRCIAGMQPQRAKFIINAGANRKRMLLPKNACVLQICGGIFDIFRRDRNWKFEIYSSS